MLWTKYFTFPVSRLAIWCPMNKPYFRNYYDQSWHLIARFLSAPWLHIFASSKTKDVNTKKTHLLLDWNVYIFRYKYIYQIHIFRYIYSHFNDINTPLETFSHILRQGREAMWDSKEYTHKLQTYRVPKQCMNSTSVIILHCRSYLPAASHA